MAPDRGPTASAALLLLADGRLPSGGHAHSGGLEEAVARGAVTGATGLAAWLAGRLHTTGLVDAAFAAAAAGAGTGPDVAYLDEELAARTPSAALRRASRAQGRGLLRTARRAWPAPALDDLWAALPAGPMWSVALGVTARWAGVDPAGAALVAATSAVQGPGWAATRLLALDPLEVAAVLARLASAVEDVARAGASAAAAGQLPAASAPIIEIGAEAHATWEVRLFAS